jgi:23S rRNA (cytidine2498-2'-O)-methyltransferase
MVRAGDRSPSRIVFSTSDDYFRAAKQELLSVAPRSQVDRLGPGTGCLVGGGLPIADLAEACRHRPIVFVRHLLREVARLPRGGADQPSELICDAVTRVMETDAIGSSVALQVWEDGPAPAAARVEHLWQRVAGGLNRLGLAPARADRDQVLSVCLTPGGVVIGLNRRADALVDWPGGRVRLAKHANQVSRSEFKLEELFKVFELAFRPDGLALDLGASPGGWTRLLRQRGLTVWAVDPADLDPSVAADPGVRHKRTTAGRFLAETDLTFDVVVNDMRMLPTLSCHVMIEAANRLRPGGLAILTLKISPHDPLGAVARSFRLLERSYEVLHARQLYHNRNEVTVVARVQDTHSAELATPP